MLMCDGSGTTCMQAAGLAGVTAAFFAFHLSPSQALAIVAAVMFVVVGDQVSLLLWISSTSSSPGTHYTSLSIAAVCACLCLMH